MDDRYPATPSHDGHEQAAPAPDRSSTQPIPAADPPYEDTWVHTSAAPHSVPHARRPHSGGISAAVLAGALVLGGAAGIGGAAGYEAFRGDSPPPASSTTNTTAVTQSSQSTEAGQVEKVASAVLPAVVKVNVAGSQGSGSGSGIVLSADGNILTNNHVIAGADADAISVTFQDGSTLRATVVGADPVTDIAVVRAQDASGLTTAALGKSGELRVGQPVIAVGAPFGLDATVTSGIVSALDRPVSVSAPRREDPFGSRPDPSASPLSTTYPAIQTDAAINPGNSGGPLVDLAGQVVGINSSIRTSGGTSTGGSIGLGFAIPIDQVLPIVEQILGDETPTHARLGISVADTAPGSPVQGAVVKAVENGSSAAQAGLKVDDVVTSVGDRPIVGSESLVATIRGHRPGEKVEVTYVRAGDRRTLTATLGSDENTTTS